MLLWRQTKEEAQVPREFRRISIRQIRKNPNQPRKLFDAQALQELADSIGKYGVITPLTVRQTEEGYELVAGERRLRAASMAGLSTVPCYIVQADDRESSLMALLENLQRKDLDCFEEAASLRRLCQEYHMTQKEAAERVGKTQSAVANKLRLLRHTPRVLEALRAGNLTERHARALLLNTRLPVSEIATATGFADSNYFSRCFRKFTGLSPREFREHPPRASE